jgi:hypothetical protein
MFHADPFNVLGIDLATLAADDWVVATVETAGDAYNDVLFVGGMDAATNAPLRLLLEHDWSKQVGWVREVRRGRYRHAGGEDAALFARIAFDSPEARRHALDNGYTSASVGADYVKSAASERITGRGLFIPKSILRELSLCRRPANPLCGLIDREAARRCLADRAKAVAGLRAALEGR